MISSQNPLNTCADAIFFVWVDLIWRGLRWTLSLSSQVSVLVDRLLPNLDLVEQGLEDRDNLQVLADKPVVEGEVAVDLEEKHWDPVERAVEDRCQGPAEQERRWGPVEQGLEDRDGLQVLAEVYSHSPNQVFVVHLGWVFLYQEKRALECRDLPRIPDPVLQECILAFVDSMLVHPELPSVIGIIRYYQPKKIL